VIVEVWAPSRGGCLEELVRGVVETFADTARRHRDATATREVPLAVGAARDEDVAVALLDDVCYLPGADGLVVVDVVLDEEDDGNFDGAFFVAPVDAVVQAGAAPKAISRSDLQFEPDGPLWGAAVSSSTCECAVVIAFVAYAMNARCKATTAFPREPRWLSPTVATGRHPGPHSRTRHLDSRGLRDELASSAPTEEPVGAENSVTSRTRWFAVSLDRPGFVGPGQRARREGREYPQSPVSSLMHPDRARG
jgi:SHS2 domain-containing protein